MLDADTGRSLPYVRAFVQALMSNLSALPCFLGFFGMLWEPRKRTWHDIVADSLVVKAAFYPPGEFGAPPVEKAPPGSGAATPSGPRRAINWTSTVAWVRGPTNSRP